MTGRSKPAGNIATAWLAACRRLGVRETLLALAGPRVPPFCWRIWAGCPSGFDELPTDAPRIAVVLFSSTFPGMTDPAPGCGWSASPGRRSSTLLAVGARAVLVDSAATELLPAAELDAFDGVLFLGGGDVDGALYGHHAPVPNSYGVDRRADEYCLELIAGVLERDQPLLAICRGSQLLNVACGGHSGSTIPERLRHP